ncbi:MAG: thymidine phosphorylase family protein [Candidatus Pacearchaeota archaeon]
MRLKAKFSNWFAGKAIVILNEASAAKINAHVGDRVLISSKSGDAVAVMDISNQLVDDSHVILSQEIIPELNISKGQFVDVEVAKNPKMSYIINKKLDGKSLSEREIFLIVNSIVKNELSEIEIAFFISAVYKSGMSLDEIGYFTKAIFNTGDKLSINGKYIVDKHCIGGLAGNRTTPIIVSICSSEGLIFPKNSSRAITSAAGTADVMETICKVDFNEKEIKQIVKKTGACLVWGGSLGFAPADDKIISVERMINIDPEPNLIASIISKKLAAGSKYILIDIPFGVHAKVSKKQGLALKRKFETLGRRFNLKLKCVLTPGNEPIGNGIGPALEIRDVISVLNGDGPQDLRDKSLFLSGEIFELAGKCKKGEGKIMARQALDSGRAFNQFSKIVEAQHGKIQKVPLGKFSRTIKSSKNGKIASINNKDINLIARISGCPKDKRAGIYLHVHVGYKVKKFQPLLTIYSQSLSKLNQAVEFYKEHETIKFG